MKMESPPPLARKTVARAAVRWHGAIEGVHQNIVYGWALDATRPEARVVLEVHFDGELVGTVSADAARPDLATTFAALAPQTDICHGFLADLGPLAQRRGTLSLRVANTAHDLADSIRMDEVPAAPLAVTSLVFGDGGLRLHGWAIDAREPRRHVTVSAYEGGRRLAHTVAHLDHPALRSHHVGAHGFMLDLPPELADGQPHSIRVVDEQGLPLNGSPLTVCTFPAGAAALVEKDQAALLQPVLDSYEAHVPRTLGLAYYPQWAARFEHGAERCTPPKLAVALIITGAANAAAIERTRASIDQQRGVRVTVHAGPKFGTLLQEARTSGAAVIGCVRAGDLLAPHALARMLEAFATDTAQVAYADSEYQGQPWFKPAWNPDYALATDFPLELLLVRTSLLDTLDADTLTTSADVAWSALATAMASPIAIVHVPRVLYHFATALSDTEHAERASAAARALRAREPKAKLAPLAGHPAGPLFQPRRVLRKLSAKDRARKVSLIIPTRDSVDLLKRCVSSIHQHTDWAALEIIVIDNGSVEKETRAWFRTAAKQGVRVLSMPGPFNFADLNNRAVYECEGEIIGLVNNDIEALHDGWLDEMVAQLLAPGVGAVGAKLLWPNGMVQHGGVLMGAGNAAGHYGNLLADQDWGDHGRNQLVHQVTGVTAACLLMRKSDYLLVGGMDPQAFPVAFNDVDLCLRLRRAGLAITWTPHARLLHAESASRGKEDSPQKQARARRELEQLRARWGAALLRDPAYHPSLNLDPVSAAFSALALPPRDRTPRTAELPRAAGYL